MKRLIIVKFIFLFALQSIGHADTVEEKGAWPIGGEGVEAYLEPTAPSTHIYRFSVNARESFTLRITSEEFPPVVVLETYAGLSIPFGAWMPPTGLPRDEFGRPITLTKRWHSGLWETVLEFNVRTNKNLRFLVRRNESYYSFITGKNESNGPTGGNYKISGIRY